METQYKFENNPNIPVHLKLAGRMEPASKYVERSPEECRKALLRHCAASREQLRHSGLCSEF